VIEQGEIFQGDIFWVTLTGSGSVQTGRRPCIVMSRLSVNNAGRTVVIVPLTTSGGRANPSYRIRIPAAEMIKDVSCTSALADSIAKCDHVSVIDKSLLGQKIGKLSNTAVIAIELGIAFVFDLR
jgi:mRNA-degrading endonuclease toxin of MazEF toxin-antitoxin module